MKKAAPVLFVLILSLMMVLPVTACSSYAVYSNQTQYGVNFDMPGSPEMVLAMGKGREQIRYITLSFDAGGAFRRMCGMNSEGLLATLQMVPPRGPSATAGATLISDLLDEAIQSASTVEQVRAIIGNRRLAHVPGFYLHSHFADREGHTLVVEIGEKGNVLLTGKENYSVVTNFHLADVQSQPEEKIIGSGADRYRTALHEIRTHMGRFNLDLGLSILQKTAQPFTQASMVFYPKEGHIYLALRGGFERIWRIDMTSGTIGTFRGFETSRTIPLSETTATFLQSWK